MYRVITVKHAERIYSCKRHVFLDSVSTCRRYGVATISRFLKIYVSFAKEPYKRDDILQKIRLFRFSQHVLKGWVCVENKGVLRLP